MDAVCRPRKHGQTGSSRSRKNNPGLRQSQHFASAPSLNPLSFTGACCRHCEISIASKKKTSNTSGCTSTPTPSMEGGRLICWSGTAQLQNYGKWPSTTRGKAQRCVGFTSTASIFTTKWATNCAKKKVRWEMAQKLPIITALFLGIIFATSPALADNHDTFYRGKTVRIVVGAPTGGGFDIYSRALARHMG